MSEGRLSMVTGVAARFATPAVRWVAMLGLCAAYIQGGLTKLFDFSSAIAEMNHFGLAPVVPYAVLTIALELIASLMILSGIYRWLGALGLAGFTLLATFVANRFWEALPPERFMMTNSFFEHLGLVGGFVLIAWHDLRSQSGESNGKPT
jgi:uncharacterized membrane protein YphA (DoxX/SURF4 family)